MGDFQIFHYVDNICTLDGGFTIRNRISQGHSRALLDWYGSVKSLPAIKNYLSARPRPGTGEIGKPGSIINTEKHPSALDIVQSELKKVFAISRKARRQEDGLD